MRLESEPDESDEDFIARIVAQSGKPDAELAEELRRLLPPVIHSEVRAA